MNKQTNITVAAEQLAEDAQALLSATAHIAEEKVVAARNRLAAALQNGRDMLADLKDTTDETIREHPYQAIGVALGVGALLGFILSRRN
jgi:ElaB/YqjD/DUF883 family membrane-anchored ribosome-binding protein